MILPWLVFVQLYGHTLYTSVCPGCDLQSLKKLVIYLALAILLIRRIFIRRIFIRRICIRRIFIRPILIRRIFIRRIFIRRIFTGPELETRDLEALSRVGGMKRSALLGYENV